MGAVTMDPVADRLLATLRRLAPAKVRVYDSSDDHRDIAVPSQRKRWGHVVQTIEARPWLRCELLDKSGAVLGYVENDGAAGEVEELTPAPGGGGGAAQSRWFLEMMIKAQTVALTYRDKEHIVLMQGMRDLMGAQTDAMRELTNLYRVQRDVSAEVATMKAAAENGGDVDQIIKLIEASPTLLQALGPLLAALMAPKRLAARPASKPAAPVVNGASK